MHKTKNGLQVGKNYETNYNQQLVSHTLFRVSPWSYYVQKVIDFKIVMMYFKCHNFSPQVHNQS